MPLVCDHKLTEQLGVLVYQIENKEAAEVLEHKSPGLFYIRESISFPNCLVVQFVKATGEVDKRLVEPVQERPGHYRISNMKHETYSSLRQLIKHYGKNPIVSTNAFESGSVDHRGYIPNTLSEYLIIPDLVKFTHYVTKDDKSNIHDLGSLPCEEDGEVAVIKETAGCYLAVNKRNGLYGKLRTSRLNEGSEDVLNLEEDLPGLLYTPPGYSLRMRYPAEAQALIDYAVPYSDGSDLIFKKGDIIHVERSDKSDKSILFGYVKNSDEKEIKSAKFPLFAVKFLKEYKQAQPVTASATFRGPDIVRPVNTAASLREEIARSLMNRQTALMQQH